jgi:predicted DNA-binding transcriptional regulator AlpA
MLKGMLSIEEVAARSGLTVGTLWNLASKKDDLPPPRMVIGKRHFYAKEDIIFWLRNRIDGRRRKRRH